MSHIRAERQHIWDFKVANFSESSITTVNLHDDLFSWENTVTGIWYTFHFIYMKGWENRSFSFGISFPQENERHSPEGRWAVVQDTGFLFPVLPMHCKTHFILLSYGFYIYIKKIVLPSLIKCLNLLNYLTIIINIFTLGLPSISKGSEKRSCQLYFWCNPH